MILEREITLKQALLGFNFTLKGLDGKEFVVSSIQGEVVQNGDIKSVKGKGLPFHRDPMSHGNLIVKFTVKFPKATELTEDIKIALEKALPGPKSSPSAKGEAEYMREFVKSDLNSNAKGGNEEDENEEGPHGHGRHQQRAECGTQ